MDVARRRPIAVALGAGVAYAAYRRGALSLSGAAGAAAVGGTIFGAGGLRDSAELLLFFGSSTALSRFDRHRAPVSGAPAGPRRTLMQVLANGGLPAALSVYGHLRPSHRTRAAFSGALAAANADTWATELGRLSPSPPRDITSGRTAEPGASGAVTPLGTAASLTGAALVASAHALLYSDARRALGIAAAGFSGSVVDSLLGATAQAVYVCRGCSRRTEDRAHAHHGRRMLVRVRGLPIMTNDAVNVCASLTGAVIAWVAAGQQPRGSITT